MRTKCLVLVAMVLVTEGQNSNNTDHSPEGKSDLARLLGALKKISHNLPALQQSNPPGYTYEGIATMALSLKKLWQELNTKQYKCTLLASRLKKDLALLQELNTTLSLPPKAKVLKDCSYPFEETNIGCFWFHQLPLLTFKDARLRCQAFGADLAIITQEKFSQFKELLGKKYGYNYYYVWVGAIEKWSGWRWIDGSKVEFSKNDWFIPNPSLRGSCMAMNGGRGYYPMPWQCDDDINFVCEKKFDNI